MRVLTENEVRHLAGRMEAGGNFALPAGTILTPLARDYLRNRRLQIVEAPDRRVLPSTLDSRHINQPRQKGEGSEALVEAITAEVIGVLQNEASKAATPRESPSAAALQHAGPHPERTSGAGQANRAVVWAIGSDHPGILASVAELLGKRNVNILEISQTILSGVFAMVVIVDITQAKGAFGELKTELEQLGREMKINLSAQRDEIFQYMHRI